MNAVNTVESANVVAPKVVVKSRNQSVSKTSPDAPDSRKSRTTVGRISRMGLPLGLAQKHLRHSAADPSLRSASLVS